MQNNTITQPPKPEQATDNTTLVTDTQTGVEAVADSQNSAQNDPGLFPEVQDNQDVIPTTKHTGWRSALSTIGILVAAPLIALFLTSFVFQSYEVDGPSMLPTLADNDRLIVMKLGKTWSKITGSDFIPARGEIIIFHRKGLYAYDQDLDKQLIKRVIALPGERVIVNNGIIIVFNDEHPDGFQPDQEAPYGKDIVTTPGDAEFTVGEGEVFVSGDNRPNSLDSRDFGPIKDDEIVGTLSLRIFPINNFRSF